MNEAALMQEELIVGDAPVEFVSHNTGTGWWKERATELDEIRKERRSSTDDNGEESSHKVSPHIVQEEVLQYVMKSLPEKADFLSDGYPYLFLTEEKRIVPLAEEDEALSLLGRLRLRATQAHTKLVWQNLKLHIQNHGKRVEIQHWGCYKDGKVYVNNGRGGMFRITPDVIEEVANGTDDVYMHDSGILPWPELKELPKVEHGMKVSDTPLSRYLDALFEPQALAPEGYHQLYLARYLALFFRGAFSLLPISLATGEQGSGKSTLFEKVMWLQKGTRYESTAMPKDLRGFIAEMTRNHVVVLDNVDGVQWKKENYVDYLCKASTGGNIPIAELYKTNSVKEYNLRCDQFINARTNPFSSERTDVTRRTIHFPVRKPTGSESRSMEEIKAEAKETRDEMLLETLGRLQLMLRGHMSKLEGYTPVTEMTEYEKFTMRIAGHEGWGDEMRRIWAAYMSDSAANVAADSNMVETVRAWLGFTDGKVYPNIERWVKAREIYDGVSMLVRDMPWRTAISFSRALRSNLSAVGCLGIKTKILHGIRLYLFAPAEVEMEECKSVYLACKSRLGGGYTEPSMDDLS